MGCGLQEGRARLAPMDILVLKLVLTPTLIAAASLAGRRWGPGVSGSLVGLPLTSGPVTFFLALSEGTGFAAATAAGAMAGVISEAAFCLAYGWGASRWPWPAGLAAGSLLFAMATVALQYLVLPPAYLFPAIVVVLVVAVRLMPRGAEPASPAIESRSRWDIPARMIVATAIVLLLTGAATALGARLTGLLSPYPVFATVLAIFAHRLQGPRSAVSVMRGTLLGLFGFAGFFLVLSALMEPAGIAAAFAVAVAVSLALQAGSLWLLRRAPELKSGT